MRIRNHGEKIILRGFRVMLFGMVPKPKNVWKRHEPCFRVMLFGMVPKPWETMTSDEIGFRVMLFGMVPKLSR